MDKKAFGKKWHIELCHFLPFLHSTYRTNFQKKEVIENIRTKNNYDWYLSVNQKGVAYGMMTILKRVTGTKVVSYLSDQTRRKSSETA